MKKKMKIDIISKIVTEKVFSIFLFCLLIIIVPSKILCSESTLYHGCYDVKSESFRFVENTKQCSKNEQLVSFSEEMLNKQKNIQKYDLDELLECVEKGEKKRRKCVKVCPRDARYCAWYCCDTDGRNCKIDKVVSW